MKFLLILGVVMQHCDFILQNQAYQALSSCEIEVLNVWVRMICKASVPCFFIISGFLFFYGVEKFTWTAYLRKLRSRGRTLLVPYLFWNVVCCLILYIRANYFGLSGEGVFMAGGAVEWQNLVKGFWIIPQTGFFPFAFAFWFMRNLMVFVVLAPLVWLLAKNVLLAFIFLLGWKLLFGDSLVWLYSFQWFVLGAFMARHRKLIPPVRKSLFLWAICTGVIILICRVFFIPTRYGTVENVVRMIQFALQMYVVYCVGIYCYKKWGRNRIVLFLVGSTFMIYASHQCYSLELSMFWTKVIGFGFGMAPIAAYILSVASMLAISLLLRYLLQKFVPGFYRIITGGR